MGFTEMEIEEQISREKKFSGYMKRNDPRRIILSTVLMFTYGTVDK